MASTLRTIIFSPPDQPYERERVTEKLAHVRRRGYSVLAVVRDWTLVELALASRRAQVVLFAYPGNSEPGEFERTVRIHPAPVELRAPTWRPPGQPATQPEPVPTASTTLVLELPEVDCRLDEMAAIRVAAYREGYADGFVDCLTIGGKRPERSNSPT